MAYEPIRIEGIITDQVGTPRNDGTAGSALYAVPFRLSRNLNADEAAHLVQLWDRPPQFTTMHRPGIARASGDRLVLDGTTIDEVEQYHAATLRLVVEQLNRDSEEHTRRMADEAARHEQQRERHASHIDEVAGRIEF